MTTTIWLAMAIDAADGRGLPELRPLLEALARSTTALRSADWNADASRNEYSSRVTRHVAVRTDSTDGR